MKTISFTCVQKLKKLLLKECGQTIRPIPKNGKQRVVLGERIKLLWNQHSKFKHFCPKCGKKTDHYELAYCNNCFATVRPFSKILGTGVITEVFEIEMCNHYHNKLGLRIYDYKKKRYLKEEEIIELSVNDGFDKPEEFVKFFKKYNLRFVQSFYVYRWRLVNEIK